MKKIFIITILANDRPGIVKTISEVLVAHGASWIDSQMSNMDDKFAGLVRISVPADNAAELNKAMQGLHDADNKLHLLIEEAIETAKETASEAVSKNKSDHSHHDLKLELVGADRPGIIDDITSVLVRSNVNIIKLQSEQREAPMSSETLFWAKLHLGLPNSTDQEKVQQALEELSDKLMVDMVIE